MQAARYGNLEQLEHLYAQNKSNAKIFFSRLDPETKLSALHYAARFHHLNICRFLIEKCHVDKNKAGEDGMTPLHYVARFRVEKDSQVNKDSRKKKLTVAFNHFGLGWRVQTSGGIFNRVSG